LRVKHSVKYSFTLHRSTAENKREKLVLESRAGESVRHIALKILAYVLFRHEAEPFPLFIEKGVGQRHNPDLVATDGETGAVRLWIDCGQIEVQRLGRIAAQNRQANIIVVKAGANEAQLYARAAAKFLPDSPARRAAIRFVGFGEDFIPAILAELRGANALMVRETDKELQVTLNNVSLTTALTVVSGDAIS
jgi:hypothetical protein